MVSKVRSWTSFPKRHFLEVSADVIEQVDAAFYGDFRTALMKGLEMA